MFDKSSSSPVPYPAHSNDLPDADGRISTNELSAVMYSLGLPSGPAEIQALVAKLDANQNGAIDFPEFLVMMAERHSNAGEGEETAREREMVEAFQEFDGDRNGFISREELQVVLAKFGEWRIRVW
jgi:calmodulin